MYRVLNRFGRRKGPQNGASGPVFPRGFGSSHGDTARGASGDVSRGAGGYPLQSSLIIETMEPRLLLSVSVSVAAIQALHDNLGHFSASLQHVETLGMLAHDLPAVVIGDTHNIGSLASLSATFESAIVAPIAEVISAHSTGSMDSADLATAIQAQIKTDFGTTIGNAVQVTDNSASGNLSLGFAVTTDKSAAFTLDFGQASATYGIHLPQVSGILDTILNFNFDATVAGAAGTPTGFTLAPHLVVSTDADSAFNVSVHATADLTGASVDLGLLTLTAGAASLDLSASIGFGLSGALDGTGLAAGTVPTVTSHVASETGTAGTSVLLDIPLTLTLDHAIPGIPAISGSMDLVVSGEAGEGNFSVDVSSIQTAVAHAMGDASFDISALNRYSTGDLINALTTVDSYLGHLAGVSALSIPIPFADGLTVGGVIDLAAQFQTQVIAPLTSVVGLIGFNEHQTNAVTLSAAALDLSHLPGTTSLHLIAHGASPATDTIDVTLSIANTYLNTQGVATHIGSIDDLVTGINQSIGKTSLNTVVEAFDQSGVLSLTLVDNAHVLTSLQLVAPAAALGFASPATATTGPSAMVLGRVPANLADLPAKIGLHILLDDGNAGTATTHSDTLSVDITFGSTYIDANGHLMAVKTVDDLVLALNQAFKSSTLYGYVAAINVAGHVELSLTDPSTVRGPNDPKAVVNHAYKTITVSSPGGSTAFADLRDFGIALAEALHLPGTAILESAFSTAADKANAATTLLAGLGFGYDPTLHELTFSIAKEFDNLISANVPLSDSFDLGSVGGLSISNATLLVTSSVLANLTIGLDLSGTFVGTVIDAAALLTTGISTAAPTVDKTALTILDRLSFQNTGITATIDAALVPTDSSKPVVIAGDLGPFSFTASPSTFYVALKVSLFLNDATAADPTTVTFTRLADSLLDGNFGDIWTLNVASGRDGLPFAELDITAVHVYALGHEVVLPSAPEIHVTIDDPADLLQGLHIPHPHVSITNFSPNLSVADILSGIQTVFSLLDSSVATQSLPLINVSIDDILSLAKNITGALTAAQADPSGSLTTISGDINAALGGDYVHLTIDAAATHLQVALLYSPGTVDQTLPFNLNLADLASFLGSDGGTLADMVTQLGTIASLGASGTLQVTANATVALTFGVDLQAASAPATASNLLTALNAGKGLRTDSAGLDDLQFTRADGSIFTVNVGALGTTATVTQLVQAINSAAKSTSFAAYDATTGGISFTDTSSPATKGVTALGLTGATAVDGGTSSIIKSADISAADPAAAYSFDINVAGVVSEVDVAADASRTGVAGLASAIRAAIDGTMVDAKALATAGVTLSGGFSPTAASPSVSLGQLVSVVKDATNHLQFIIRDAVLGQDPSHAIHAFAITDVAAAAVVPGAGFSISSINGSHVALDLGLGSDTVTVGGASPHVISGKLEQSASTTDRFTLDTGRDASNNLLTGLTAHVGIVGTNLNFNVGIGALSASIVGGTATFGKDLGLAAGKAGTAGFKAGNGLSDPAELLVSLNDGTASTAIGFSHLGSLHVAATANAALDVRLPVQVFGIDAGTVTLQINNLFGSLGPSALATRTVVANPQLNLDNFSPSSILNDPETLISGLDQFLGLLDGGLAQQIYGLDLPLVGKVLLPVGTFFSTLHSTVIGELNTLLDDFRASHPGQPVTTQNIVTQGLQWVLTDFLNLPGTITSYIDDIAHPTVLSFFWSFSDPLVSKSVSVSSDLGLPGLGLNLAGATATLNATLHVSLGFGYKASAPGAVGGFFVYDTGDFTNAAGASLGRVTVTPNNLTGLSAIDFKTSHALDLSISVQLLTPTPIGFTLGFLRMMASVGLGGTSLTGDLFVDIGPNDKTGMLFFRDFSKGNVLNVELAAALKVDLMLSADLSTPSLPSVSAELMFGYAYDKLLTKALTYSLTDNAGNFYTSGVTTPLSILDVQVDVGAFLSGFLKPIIEDIDLVIAPLRPILDFLNDPIPGISDLIGNTSILDIAALALGEPAVASARKFIVMLDEFDDLAKVIKALPGGSSLELPFGSYVFGDGSHSTDPRIAGATRIGSGTIDPFSSGSLKGVDISAALAGASTNANNLTNSLDGVASGLSSQLETMKGTTTSSSSSTSTGGSFDLPFLHSPMAALQMLTGQIPTIDLVHWTLPTFDFTFTKDMHVTFFGIPHVAEIGGDIIFSVGATIKLAFGYDTTGIIQFMSDHNPLDFINGLYIDDTQGPQLILHASITGQLGLDLVLVKAGIGATLSAEMDFQFADFSHTGKVRLSTIFEELITTPQDIFVIHGELDVKIYLWVWVGVDTFLFGTITFYENSYNLYGPATLYAFTYDPTTQTPVSLAHQTGGVLDLNIGAHADRQETGANIANPNQTFIIESEGGSKVTVNANGVSTTYDNVTSINADLGSGNNNVRFINGVTADVTITGGDGNNVVDLGGVTGDPLINLGNGNNTISAAAADTTIITGSGNNKIFANNSGNTTITTGDGNNVITGGTTSTARDTITVGDGNNVIYGGSGSDVITVGGGGTGANVIYGADGTNTITINGTGSNIIFGHGAHNAADITTDTVTATQVSVNAVTGTGNSTIVGGSGNDIIFGVSGNNTITGHAGHDMIFGAGGTVTLDGHGGIVRASDTMAGGGNNTINTGDGGAVVIGGGGNNTITGGAGADILIGGDGAVDGASGGTAGQFSIRATSQAGGSNTIYGMGGDDVILGGIGSNTLDGGTGNDLILGHDGIVLRDAATSSVSAVAHLVSMQTTDETLGGNSILRGGLGNDVLMGGAGANRLDGGGGSDVIVGHFGTLDATANGRSIVVSGRDGGIAGNGNDIITATQNAVVIGGGGNNTITTTDAISYGNPTLSATDTNVNDVAPPVTPSDRTVVAFGANGTVTFDYLHTGGISLHSAATVEDAIGGNNTITVGDGGDYVFGGVGSNTITAGTPIATGHTPPVGDAIILGHVGSVVIASDTGLVTVTENGASVLANAGNDVINAYGDALVITGFGSNTVATHDILLAGQQSYDWSETVVAGAGSAVFGFGSNGQIWVHSATTTPGLENTSGFNRITMGDGDDIVIGGAGGSNIAVGNGADIVLGHLGAINLDALFSPDLTGAHPDVVSFTNGQDGTALQIPGGAGPTGSHITAGNGDDVVMGGAGTNFITVGDGDDIVFGASGAVTRNGLFGTSDPVFATTMEDALGGNNVIVTGNGNDAVFGGAGANTMTIGTGTLGFNAANDIVLGHSGHVTWAADHQSMDVVGDQVLPSAFIDGNDVIDAYQNTLVITGGGDNVVTTHDQTATVPSAQWTEVVIGGAAKATIGTLSSGQFELLSAQTLSFQEDFGGANILTVGDGADVVIGGSGGSTIRAGNGDDVILGHLGEIHLDRLAQADVTGNTPDVLGYAQPQDGGAVDFLGATITAGNGRDVIIGGNGDNSIATGDGGSVIFGAAGAVTRDGTRGDVLIEAHTTEELSGGDSTITTGNGDNVIFGGRGDNVITAGTETAARLGNDVILGHAGRVAYSADIQIVTVTGGPSNGTPDVPSLTAFGDDRIDAYGSAIVIAGSGSDVIATHDHASKLHAITEFTEVVLGDSGMVVAGIRSSGQFLLNAATVAGADAGFGGSDVIGVGDSNAVVIDGAGANAITAGSGAAIILAGFGMVAEDPVTHGVLNAALLGSGLGFMDTATVGTSAAFVIGATDYTVAQPSDAPGAVPAPLQGPLDYLQDPAAPGPALIPALGPIHLIAGSETLAVGSSLSALAASIGGSVLAPAGLLIAPLHPAPTISAFVLDANTGAWILDETGHGEDLLSINGENDLVLDVDKDFIHEIASGLLVAA